MDIDYQLLKRFLEGKEEKGDKAIVLSWFSTLKHEQSLRKHYHQYWNQLPGDKDIPGYDEGPILDAIYHEIKLEESRELKEVKRINRILQVVQKVAAILIIPLIVYLAVSRNELKPSSEKKAHSEIYSPLGTRTMFYLPDGSSGWLNGGSYLKFPTQFKSKSREVILRGEAYFDVDSDPRKPFRITGKGFQVVSFGTTFNVQAYPEDTTINVTLESGVIEVSSIQNGKIQSTRRLMPDQMCTLNLRTSTSRITNVNAYYRIAWKEGKLVFRDETLKEVIRRINRWYNVEITIKDKALEQFIYRATFQDETLDEVLKLLELSAPIRYKDLGRKQGKNSTFGKRRIEIYYDS